MSTLTVEALENIAKLARQRIDAGLRHHGEQWRLGGRTGINFMMEKLRRLATPQPPKGDGEVPVQELIEQLQEACVTSDGTPLPDYAEPWGCDVGLLRKAIAALSALSALPQHLPVEPETNAQVAELDSVLRERGLPTVADALGYSRNYAEATPHLTQTGKDHILSLCTMLEIATQHPSAEVAGSMLSLPEDGAYIIKFEDASVEDEFFAMGDAREIALHRFDQISGNWNAHLFVKIKTNYLGNPCPSAEFAPISQHLATDGAGSVSVPEQYVVGKYGEWGSSGAYWQGQAPGYPLLHGAHAVGWIIEEVEAKAWAAHKNADPALISDPVVKALAAKCGVYYFNGKVNLGAPLYAFTPTEIIEFARRLAGADHA